MKKGIILFFLLVNMTWAYSQSNTIQIYNFSAQTIQFKLIGADISEFTIDCQPIIQSVDYTSLGSGQSVVYSQYNNSHLVTPPIYTWDVMAYAVGGPSYVANPSLAPISTALTNVTQWRAIQINVNNGASIFDLGINCGGNGGVFTSPAGAPVTATWNTLAGTGNVVVFIN